VALQWWQLVSGLVFVIVIFSLSATGDCLLKIVGVEFVVDSWSYGLTLISFWVIVLAVIRRQRVEEGEVSGVLALLVMVLLVILCLTFTSSNILGFYFFFEASLIPMFLIILGFGYQPERLQAGMYFIFYTLGASLPLLFFIGYGYSIKGDMQIVPWFSLGLRDFSLLASLVVIGAFLVKTPLFLVHLWLPRAHVEAPVSGSMILAGVLLKLGGYGIGRVGSIWGVIRGIGVYLIGLSLVGAVVVGFICCQINDLKALVAYSSVAHMGIVTGGLFRGFKWGLIGALLIIIGHGISSSGLFFIVNVYYERSSRRRMYLNKGFLSVLPVASLILFLLCVANISAPPTVNFISEIYLLSSLLGYETLIMLVLPVGAFLGTVFTILIFSFTQHGKFISVSYGVFNLIGRELLIMLLHVVPLNFIFLRGEVLFF
jgi:NADH-ubiquinone oxidoreductase chain 4